LNAGAPSARGQFKFHLKKSSKERHPSILTFEDANAFATVGDYVLKPRILVLTSTFPRWKGDVEPPFVYELSRRLAVGYEVCVLAPHAPGSESRETMDGIHVQRFRYAPDGWQQLAYRGGILANLRKSPALLALVPLFLAAQLLSAVRTLRRESIGIIHSHWLFPQGAIALLARALAGSQARVLCTAHGGDLYGLTGPVFKIITKMVAGACDHLTVVSRAMRTDLLKIGVEPRKVSVIPMGVDLQHSFMPSVESPRPESLLFVGRLVEKKGLKYLLEAMPHILKRLPEAQLKVVGDGPSRPELEKIVKDLGLRDRVKFLGAIRNEELPAIYQKAGVVVFPSVVSMEGDREGFGLVIVEALGCGCAIVVTDLPAMQDIVQDGRTALVVEQKNPEQITRAVSRLAKDPDLRRSLGLNGRKDALTRFDWETIMRKYKETFAGLD
jgi:glycosyltransferase involved in cell wall biosynthesis